jgi:membrane-bound lytic murein transglycosylase B
MSEDQRADLEKKAHDAGLSILNYLRSLLGWALEQQGARKDLSNESLSRSKKQRKR